MLGLLPHPSPIICKYETARGQMVRRGKDWSQVTMPHTPAECPCGQRETLRTALVGRSACVRHILVVTVYVTWHVLWRKQWTLTIGIMVVVTIGAKPAHLEFVNSTMGPVLWEFHYLLIIFSVAEAREFLHWKMPGLCPWLLFSVSFHQSVHHLHTFCVPYKTRCHSYKVP